MKTWISIFFGLLIAGSVMAQTGSGEIVITRPFTNSITLTSPQSTAFPAITSIVVTFPSGSQSSIFTVTLTRDGIAHRLATRTYTGQTLTWYVPNGMFLVKGDQLTVSNSVSTAAVLICNESIAR
jgi:hypothetical protein